MKLKATVFLAFLSMTLNGCKTASSTEMNSDNKSVNGNTPPSSDQDTPFVECADNIDKEILISAEPERGMFLYSSQTSNPQSISNKIAASLKAPGIQRTMQFEFMGKECQMVNRSSTVGIEQIDCTIQRGAHLKFLYENGGKHDFWIAKGTLHFYRNMHYDGNAQLTLDITTTGNLSASIKKLFKYNDCKVVGLSKGTN